MRGQLLDVGAFPRSFQELLQVDPLLLHIPNRLLVAKLAQLRDPFSGLVDLLLQAGSADGRIPAAMPPKLLYPLKGIHVDDRLLGMLHLFLDLEANKAGVEIDRAAGVSEILQKMHDSAVLPAIGIVRPFTGGMPTPP